ncbi:MAG: hypothetical protein ACHRHE_02365 [Tepidisphaerales bacterium]
MSDVSSAEFAAEMLRLAQESPPFKAEACYDPDGDCIEFIIRPDSFYARRLDELVTVYYSHETNEITGSLIKGVAAFIRRLRAERPGARIIIHEGRVKIEHILLARLLTGPEELDELATLAYPKLIDAARAGDVEAELACV